MNIIIVLCTVYCSLFTLSLNGCGKKADTCIKGRVVRVSCASLVVQVLNKDSVGEYGWRDLNGNTVYNNVFTVKNACNIGKWGRGEEIYFSINDTAVAKDCITCMMFDSPPVKTHQLANVGRRPCK